MMNRSWSLMLVLLAYFGAVTIAFRIEELESLRSKLGNDQSFFLTKREIPHASKSKNAKNSKQLKSFQNLTKSLTSLEIGDDAMFRFLGDGRTYVIFDCEKPSYINDKHQQVILEHHIINHMLERKKDPGYNDTDGYVCDKKEKLWRMNPEEKGCTPGLISFMAEKAYAADSNFIVLADEKILKDYFGKIILETPEKEREKASRHYASIIKNILTAIHHPDYYKVDSKIPTSRVDLLRAAEKNLRREIKTRRKNDINIIKRLFAEKLGDSEALPNDDAYSFVVMNCSHPEYLLPTSSKAKSNPFAKYSLVKKDIWNQAHVEMLKRMGKCNTREQIWYLKSESGDDSTPPQSGNRRRKKVQYLTYNHKSNGLGCSPNQEKLSLFDKHDICHDYMAYMLHPAYYSKQFKKPRECSASKSQPVFQELSLDAWRRSSATDSRN